MQFDDAMDRALMLDMKPHILLGNGFSVGAHQDFAYGSLYEQARNAKLPSKVDDLFKEYGTTNFEAVLQRLDIGIWLAEHYGLSHINQMQDDYEATKDSLIDSIASIHPAAITEFSNRKLESGRLFPEPI